VIDWVDFAIGCAVGLAFAGLVTYFVRGRRG
jgi:large-conductance mechanosensitive channel